LQPWFVMISLIVLVAAPQIVPVTMLRNATGQFT
jgi:hypothetical protein